MSYGAVATMLSLLAGDAFRPAALTGLLLCMLGAPLTALDKHHADPRNSGAWSTGVLFALGAAFCYGVGFWIQGRFSVPQLGTPGTLLINYMCGVVVAIVAFARGRNASGALLDSPRFLVQAVASIAALACLAAGTGGGNTALSRSSARCQEA
jgi:drug/metabolite transporter (DMT)-like permease